MSSHRPPRNEEADEGEQGEEYGKKPAASAESNTSPTREKGLDVTSKPTSTAGAPPGFATTKGTRDQVVSKIIGEDRSLEESGSSERSDRQQSRSVDSKWEEMFNRLIAYKEKHGDTLVPNRYQEDPQLGSWVSTQRRHYKTLISGRGETTPMNQERAKRLVDIGFQWVTKDPRHVPWEKRYAELVEFKKKYGHSQVPIGWEKNTQLANWVSTQRQEYKLIQKGRSSRLTRDRMDKLNQIEFVWEAQRGGPRRKRRATVAVPPRANPVDLSTRQYAPHVPPHGYLRGGSAWRGGWAVPHSTQGGRGGGGYATTVASPADASGEEARNAPDDQLGGFNSMAATSSWQMMSHGAFQQGNPPTNVPLGMNPAFIPMAAQWQMAPSAGYQYGMMPTQVGASAAAGQTEQADSDSPSPEATEDKGNFPDEKYGEE